jgi:hypothetical protein
MHIYGGLSLAIMCVAMGVSGMLRSTELPSERVGGARLAVLVLLFGAANGCWIVVRCCTECFTVDDRRLTYRRLFRTSEFELDRIVSAEWLGRAGMLKLVSPLGPTTIRFDALEPEQRWRLVQYLHDNIPVDVQSGWTAFAHHQVPPNGTGPTTCSSRGGDWIATFLRGSC